MSQVAGPASAEKPAGAKVIAPWQTSDKVACVLIALLLSAHWVLGYCTAKSLSVTNDEYWHLPVGILNLRTWRFDYEPLNPPLTRLISACAVIATEPGCYEGPVPLSEQPTTYGLHYLRLMKDRHQPSYLWARTMNVGFSVLTGLMIAAWCWRWWGRTAACLSTLLWCTEPTVLAHASLVTSDIGIAWATLAVWYTLWRYFQQPTRNRAIVCGVMLGLAQLIKYTAVLLVPLACVAWLVWWIARWRAGASQSERGRLWHLVLMPVICLFVLNLGYGFQGTFLRLNQIKPRSQTIIRAVKAFPLLNDVPLPVPRDYIVGVDVQKHVLESQHPVYLDRVWSVEGFPYYFLWALWYKLPHLWQLLILFGAIRAAWNWRDPVWRSRIALIVVPLVSLLIVADLSRVQLGVRYVLPVFPFLCMLAASTFAATASRAITRCLCGLLAIAVIVAPLSLRDHPEHIAYFNELAGGTNGGPQHLLDSNLDWGQDLLEMKAYIDQFPDENWLIAYFGSVPPGELGLHYAIPPAGQPSAGSYAVSVNFVYGRPHVVLDENGTPVSIMPGQFNYLRASKPVKKIGASIWIYRLDAGDAMRWGAR